jgi:UDP-2,3-diacylglucosamine pyrophosphatase LpxH
VRTLVISDIHLGQGGGVSVLTRPRPLAKLLEALDQHDRLVLLGDTVELQESRPEQAFPVAEPVIRAIAEHLGEDKQVLVVPGNHDHALVRRWARELGPELQRDNVVPVDASPWLERFVSWFDATRVEVHYPGVWLGERIWATHGHYLNHYLRPVSSYGLYPRKRVKPATPAETEYIATGRAAPHLRDGMLPERWLDRHIPARLAPLSSFLLDRQMQRHALQAMLVATQALEVEADHVIFGHVHRRGPRERDDLSRWSGPDGHPQLLNTGCWRYEPVVVRGLDGHRASYWPGGAVSIGEDGVPRSVGLLEGLSEKELVAVI